MLKSSRRAHARRAQGSAIAAAAALVVTLAPAIAFSSSSSAAAPAAGRSDSTWRASSARPGASHDGHRRQVNPSAYRAYTLSAGSLGAELDRAPAADSAAPGASVTVPAPNGKLVTFKLRESSVMEPALAAAHPEIKTYEGQAVGFNSSIAILTSPGGFHASVRGDHDAWFIDPAYQNDTSLYLSYFGKSLPAPEKAFAEPELDQATRDKIGQDVGEGPGQLTKTRTYRLALLTDPTYAEFVAPGTNDGAHDTESNSQVLAAKALLMQRVNQVYGQDMAIKMVLIDQSDKLNLNTVAKARQANGPCGAMACYTDAQLDPAATATNGCTGGLLTRNRFVVGTLVGASSFDIGHIGLGINGGGVASRPSVGNDIKAQGCTGLPFPTGDFYAIDYVAHEMGHQFSGNHTFNGTQVNCSGGNRSAAASVEPGSGSSVMAYAGICGSDDLQPHTDPYFSQRTQAEVTTYVTQAPASFNEVQSVVFDGAANAFDGTDSFTLQYGAQQTAPITRGTNYTAAGIAAAIQAVVGGTVTVTPLFATTGTTLTDSGFTVSYSGSNAGVDLASPTLVPTGFTGYTNDVVKGGPGTNGGTASTTANHNPEVVGPVSKTIPMRTPFALTASATDPDGDDLVYLWEQNDRGGAAGTALFNNTKTNGPLFRVFGHYADVSLANSLLYHSPGENLADGNPTRVFPDMDQVLDGSTNAATGTCPLPADTSHAVPDGPELECFSEFLPTSDYVGDANAGNDGGSLDFRLTARDNGGDDGFEAGGYDFADVKLRIDKFAGPFLVTSQATGTTYDAGSTQTITWDVNNTAKPTLAPNVKISFSSDGGQTFDRVLTASTPNDGSESVKVPTVNTTQGRIKIEAVDNYFFDVNDAPITVQVTDTTAPQTFITSGPTDNSYLLATSATFGLGSNESPVTFTCTLDGANLPCPGSSITVSNLSPGTHTFTAQATDNVGNVDTSPAVVHFTVPVDDPALTATTGKWKRQADGAAYLGTVSVAEKKGSTLSTTISGAKQVALVVSTGKKLGEVKVKLNGNTLRTISLKGPAAHQVTMLVSNFGSPASGTLTIVTAKNKKVVIDGLLVVTG